MLSFLTPLFLVGLAALASPIIVHLMHKERKEVVQFPSLMFLEKIEYKSTSHQQIHNWPLFLLRCLALILLVSAFSRPFLERNTPLPASALGSQREVVILLDRSYSMGYGDRWTRAVAAARTAIDGIGVADKATLVVFSDRPTALNEATPDKGALRAALGAVTLGSGETKYGPALKLAEKITTSSTIRRREVILISDFQKVGWDGHEEVHFSPGTTLTPIDLGGPVSGNVAITSVTPHRESVDGREQLTATARVANSGTEARTALNVTLDVNGRIVETKTVSVPAKSAAMVNFTPALLPPGTTRAVIRAGSDSLPQDNAFNMVLAPEQDVGVLVLEPPYALDRQTLYLRAALGRGDNPSFRVDVKKVGAFSGGDLTGRSVVVLNDAPLPSGDAERRLRDWVEQGGGLFIALGEESSKLSWPADASVLLPATLGPVVDKMESSGTALASLDYGNPMFEAFSAPHSGEFSSARFYRYRKLTVPGDSGVVARFEDGSVAIAERAIGKGKVVLFASNLDNSWNDLPLQPVFLPWVHELMKHVGTYGGAKPWFTVGQVVDVPAFAQSQLGVGANTTSGGHVDVDSPTGKSVRAVGGDTSRYLELEDQGFYTMRPSRGVAGRDVALAVNLDLTESDLSHVDPAEVVAAVTGTGDAKGGTVEGAVLTREEQEKRQTLWWFILIGVLVALAGESWMSNRMSRNAR